MAGCHRNYTLGVPAPVVIWQSSVWAGEQGTRSNFEFDFVRDRLISALPNGPSATVFDDGRFETGADAAVVVVAVGKVTTVARVDEYLARFPPDGRLVLIHLGAEDPTVEVPFYRFADLVLRNYYDPRFERDPRVVHVPLGYQTGYWREPRPRPAPPGSGFAERDLLWTFVGQLKSDRRDMLAELGRLPGDHVQHLSSGWMSADQLPIEVVRRLLERSVLAPCPMGWVSMDSFRVMEALEAGALPVVVDPDGYFDNVYPGHGFLVASSWRDARRRIRSLRRSGELADRWRSCVDWYPRFWDALHATLSSRYAAVFGA